MSVVKSYSDARKELERIASQRKHFLSNSRSVRYGRRDAALPHSYSTSVVVTSYGYVLGRVRTSTRELGRVPVVAET